MENRIREIRLAHGLSQEALAVRVGTTKAQISKLEKNQRRLTDVWIDRLARALVCHPFELMGDTLATNPREQALIDLFRGLSPDEQDKFLKVADALAQPSATNAKQRNG